MIEMTSCMQTSFDQHVGATFFQTARAEIENTWDYLKAQKLGWFGG